MFSVIDAKTNKYKVNKTGTYYVGDPCYCFSHSETTWSELCDSMDDTCQGILTNKDNTISVLMLSTCYGDGTYQGTVDEESYEFPVDSGSLGLVHEFDIQENCSYLRYKELGATVYLSAGSVVTRSNTGEFKIVDPNGNTVVLISSSYDDNDEYASKF